MSSITTMASSTTNPVEIVRAISERLSMLYPRRYITAKVPISDTGTAMLGMSVARALRRNRNTTMMTSTMEMISVRSTSLTEARMVVVRSRTMVMSMPCGIEAFSDGNWASNAIHRLKNVRSRLAIDNDDDCRLAIQIAGSADVLRGVYDVRHIGQAHSRAAIVAKHQGLILVRAKHLVIGDDIRGDQVVGDLAGGLMRVLQAEHGLDILQRDAHAAEPGGIDFHAYGRKRASAHAHLPNALDLRKLLLDDRGSCVVQFGAVVFARSKPEDHDRRVGGVDLAIGRIGGKVGRQKRSRRIDAAFHVSRGAIDVAAEIELQRDGSGAERTRRGHFGESRNVAKLALQGSGDGGCHGLRAGARQTCGNRNGREVNLRQRETPGAP